MDEQTARTQKIIGAIAMERLRRSRVAVFGLGGVGGYAAEALARSGIGTLHLVDGDDVAPSNLNRQIAALHSTLGRKKAEVLRARALDINPALTVRAYPLYYLPGEDFPLDFGALDYIVDAIDMAQAKVALAVQARDAGVPIISCMGTGNKLDPSRLQITDIFKTSVCPLARVMRRELSRAGIETLPVVFSTEPPRMAQEEDISPDTSGHKRNPPGSTSFVPGAAGLMLAGKVFNDLIEGE